MTFFIIHHELKDGKGKEFLEWLRTRTDEDWAKIHERNLNAGMWNHSIIPTGEDGPVYCIWESKDDMSLEEFHEFVEGPNGPTPGFFRNHPYKMMDGFKPPYPSHFNHEGDATPRLDKFPRLKKLLKETGSSDTGVVFQRPLNNNNFFMVHHTFRDGKSDDFFAWNDSMTPEKWNKQWEQNLSENLWNHTFIPTGKDGPVFCLWESKNDGSVDDYNKFLDGPKFSCPGMFHNNVHKVLKGFPEPYHTKFESGGVTSRG